MKQQLLLILSVLCVAMGQSQATFNDGVLEYTVTDDSNNYVSVKKYNNICPIDGVTIPETVTNEGITYLVTGISENGFKDCVGMTSISIPDSVNSIGEEAFTNCSGLTDISIPDGVTSIANGTFSNCNFLMSISLPDSLESIGDSAFLGCQGLSDITIPESVTSIGSAAFGDCRSLTSVVLPEGLTSIEVSTFVSCRSLTSINIPDGVTSIGKDAFLGCFSLETLDLPESVTSIGNYAFDGCTALTSVTVHWDSPLEIVRSVFREVAIENVTLWVPTGLEEDYLEADVWKDFDVTSLSLPEFVIGTTLRLYPNPVSEFLHINLNNAAELKQVVIFNSLGQLMVREKEASINVSNYAKGLYFAQIETTKGMATKKFMIK